MYHKNELEQLKIKLLNASTVTSVESIYPQNLLFAKMYIWLFAFIVIAIALYFFKSTHKNAIRTIVIGFYLIGCLANLLIVPHPTWVFIALVPIVVVPFLVTNSLLFEVTNIIKQFKSNNISLSKQIHLQS